MFEEILGSESWEKVEKITKGWSSDVKYRITTMDAEHLQLRISDISEYEKKKKEYEIIGKFKEAGFRMSAPMDFGVCHQNQNVYMLLEWIDGESLEDVLPGLSEEEQYRIGRKAGKILKQIHSIKVDPKDIPTKTRAKKKLAQLKLYEESNLRVADDEAAILYVKEHIDQICKEKAVYTHGDFHPGNLIYMEDGNIGVIDFNRWKAGDPYEEFYKLESFARELSVPYCIGTIEAYFGDREIPVDFWQALAVYVAQASLYSIKWAEAFGQSDIDGMVKRCMQAFEDYDYFRQEIPKWFKRWQTEEERKKYEGGN